MRVLVQKVQKAHVEVDGKVVAQVGPGLLFFVGIAPDDQMEQVDWMARKCMSLRLFSDEAGKMNLSLLDVDGEALVVSQFTLYGDARKGNRPSFIGAAPPEHAEPLVEAFASKLEDSVRRVQRGVFGANMAVHLVNDGPVTLWLEREPG